MISKKYMQLNYKIIKNKYLLKHIYNNFIAFKKISKINNCFS